MVKKHLKKQPSPKPVPALVLPPSVQLILAVLLFLGSAVFVHDRDMTAAEIYIFNFLYGLPEFFTPIFLVITQAGNVYVFFVLALLLLVKRYYQIVVRLLLTGSLAYLLAGVGKDLVGRGRPEDFINELVYREAIVRGSGFPSGHTALATAIALTISLYLPARYKWIAPLIIILVGLSRIQLGVHGPMDVIGGFAIGWGVVALFKFVQIRLVKDTDKTRS